MSATPRRMVLVTGCPRSGTTAIGRALSLATGAREIHEPLNALAGDKQVTSYFEVPGSDSLSVDEAAELVERVRSMRLRLRSGLFPDDGAMKRSAKFVVGGRTRLTYRRAFMSRPSVLIWKDPFGLFWLPALDDLSVDTVVTYRPPLAVAASFRRLGWSFDVRGLRRRLEEAGGFTMPHGIDELIRNGAQDDPSLNGAAVWLMCYAWLANTERRTPIIDSARFAVQPSLYSSLYQNLRLKESPAFRRWQSKAMVENTTAVHQRDYGRSAHDRRRDLSRINKYHDRLLTPSHVQLIRSVTDSTAQQIESRFWDGSQHRGTEPLDP